MLKDSTIKHGRSDSTLLWRSLALGVLLALTAPWASGASPKRVLILDPFGRDVAPFSTAVSAFRTTLARELGEPVDLYELPLDLARISEPEGEGPLVAFLEGRIKSHPVDLVVPIGGAGVQFAVRHRERLLPDTPVLVVGSDPRFVTPGFLRTNATLVTQKVNLSGMVEDILQVQPQTTNIAVVFGASALERYWVNECRREFQSFTNRVGFTWLDDLPLDQVLERCAALPPRSFILHILFVVDAAGVPCEKNEALRRLHQVANAPLFGYFASEFGLGTIGGRLYRDFEIGTQGARTAIRILRGERPGSIPPQVFEAAAPVFDWRELQRWHISEASLPPGSVVRFRQPSTWQLYRWHIAGIISLCLLEAVLIVLLVTNLVKRRRAERSMRESQERLSLATMAAGVGVWIWDISDNQLWASAEWRRLFGFPPGAALDFGKVIERIHADDRPAVERAVKRAIEGQANYVGEYRVALPDGTQRWISARGRLDSAAGTKRARMVGVAVDVTERKEAEAEVQRQRDGLAHVSRVSVMGELAASVAHELNQPLGAILANAEAAELFLAQDPPALHELRDILADIRRDDERAGEVIRRMRELLRKGDLERQPLQLDLLVEEVFRLVAADASLRTTAMQAVLAPDLPLVSGDRIQLQQVLLNLMMNALEAMAKQPPDQRRLLVRTGHTGDGWVQLSVTDSGPGIEPACLPRLFDPFFTTKPNGIGMGLSISRKIIEAHQGRIWAENRPGGGAVFHVSLPALSGQGPVAGGGQDQSR